MELATVTLLHVLVLVYWLGGDLGAFYASTVLTDRARPTAARAMAGVMLGHVDMAPRTALIASMPTGVSLIALNGWWPLPVWMVAGVWAGSLLWIALVWWLHLRHVAPGHPLRTLDLALRWIALLKLVWLASGIAVPFGPLPLFLALKLAILAAAIGCGLLIRRMLRPFGPAFGALAAGTAGEAEEAVIGQCLARARPVVLVLWLLLLAAAWLGIAQPF
jgi:hypothetical protein